MKCIQIRIPSGGWPQWFANPFAARRLQIRTIRTLLKSFLNVRKYGFESLATATLKPASLSSGT